MRTKINSLNAGHIILIGIVVILLYWWWPGTVSDQPWNVRKARYYDAALAAEPLIEAIGRYSASHGSPPGSLDDLIPGYIDRIPGTGVAECSRFKYASYGASRISIVWYDLGSRHGEPSAKESRFPDGDPGHALLLFTIGAGDGIVDAKFDRMPKTIQPVEFDSGKWLAGEDRIAMAAALPDVYELGRMTRGALEQLLGPPDGDRVLRDTPWELRLNCPRGIAGREVLLYWPTESYPRALYGGKTELVGSWLYVHE